MIAGGFPVEGAAVGSDSITRRRGHRANDPNVQSRS